MDYSQLFFLRKSLFGRLQDELADMMCRLLLPWALKIFGECIQRMQFWDDMLMHPDETSDCIKQKFLAAFKWLQKTNRKGGVVEGQGNGVRLQVFRPKKKSAPKNHLGHEGWKGNHFKWYLLKTESFALMIPCCTLKLDSIQICQWLTS